MPVTPSELYRRISARIESGKAITLSPEELDLFVAMGGYEVISKYAAEWSRRLAEDRIAVRTAAHAEAMDKAYKAQFPKPDPNPEVESACRRAWELTQPKSGPRKK